jgi:DNA-directed RNA polymerase specialized sigma24 family protein
MNTAKRNYHKKKSTLKKISKIESGLLDDEEDIFDEFEEEEIEEDNEQEDVEEDEVEEEEVEEEIETPQPVSEIKKRGKKPVDKAKFYVDPKQFDEQIVVYYESGQMSDELALMVSKIAHKLSYAPNFINYTFREEMVGDGIIRMFKALMSKKYDREKGTNPFSYFTRIAFNAFRNRIKKEKHMRDTHEKYQNELMLFSENYNTLVRNNQSKILKDRLNKE